MPVDVQCEKCSRKFRAPDKLAGKKVKCPGCQAVILVPGQPSEGTADKESPAKPASGAKAGGTTRPPTLEKAAGAAKTVKNTPVAKPLDKDEPAEWHMMTSEGEEFGPVTKTELDEWAAEGRLDGTCQVLQDGWEQWRWADEVYPELAEAKTEEPATEPGPLAAMDEAAGPAIQVASGQAGPGAAPGGAALTPRVRTALAETRPWVMFLSILGLVLNGFGALGLLGFLALVAFAAGLGATMLGLSLLVFPALNLVAAYYLLNYGLRLGGFLRSGDAGQYEEAMIAQKSFWKLTGIVTLVILVLYLVIFVMATVLGGFPAMMPQQSLPKG